VARKQKLKVFRTPIGFHDAYVAAPSQKAALQAWGSHADLFARGVAEVVTDEDLIAEPLANPGEVIRRVRGSEAEHLAATDRPRQRKSRAAKASEPNERAANASESARGSGRARTKARKRLPPRPSREKLEAAENALAELKDRQRSESDELHEREAEIDRQRREIERKRREIERSHGVELGKAEAILEDERRRHARALDLWISKQ